MGIQTNEMYKLDEGVVGGFSRLWTTG
jgi:hypothetical protein